MCADQHLSDGKPRLMLLIKSLVVSYARATEFFSMFLPRFNKSDFASDTPSDKIVCVKKTTAPVYEANIATLIGESD